MRWIGWDDDPPVYSQSSQKLLAASRTSEGKYAEERMSLSDFRAERTDWASSFLTMNTRVQLPAFQQMRPAASAEIPASPPALLTSVIGVS